MGEWKKYLEKHALGETKDILTGGKADGKSNKDFTPDQLALGRKTEREHTTSDALAEEIARDHLQETPDYYDRLKAMELEAERQGMKAASVSMVRNRYTGEMMAVPTDKMYETFRQNSPGVVERSAIMGGGALGTGLGAGAASLLAGKAGIGGKGGAAISALGALGGGALGLMTGGAARSGILRSRLDKEWGDLSKHKVSPQALAKPAAMPAAPAAGGVKQASLDAALGALYRHYGPTLNKHAAAAFFDSRDQDRMDREVLGAQFCKMASVTGVDPWAMAVQIVKGYSNLEKLASSRSAQERELAGFYLSWADEMVKKANPFTSLGNLASKAKAVAGAVAGPQGALRSTKHLAAQGVVKGERGGIGQQIGKALHRQGQLQEAGGGSIARGKALQDQALAQRGMKQELLQKGWTPPAPGARPGTRSGTKVRATKPSELGNYLRGAAVLSGLGVGGAAVMGGGNEQPYGGPAFGGAYA